MKALPRLRRATSARVQYYQVEERRFFCRTRGLNGLSRDEYKPRDEHMVEREGIVLFFSP